MRKIIVTFTIFLCSIFSIYTQESQYFRTPELLLPYVANAPEVNSYSVVLIDISTGALLYAKNTNEEIPPASLTKLMTMHIVMKEIQAGRASMDEVIPVTTESWALKQPRGSSLMFLEPGQIVTLREILLGLAVSSGNDAAVAVALRFAPSMEEFARLMTMEARSMGLTVTRFTESSGISEQNMTTAEEYAWFCRRYLYQHPQNLKDFHSVLEFSYPMPHNISSGNNTVHTITQGNRNHLLQTFPGVDGLKTGYIEESGYNIALTAERDGTRFLSVSMGAESMRERNTDGTALLTWAFNNFKTARPVVGYPEKPRLWKGKENTVDLYLAHTPDFTSPVNRANNLNYGFYYPAPIIAPLEAGTVVGELIISDEYGELHRVPLVTARSYKKGNIFKRIWHSVKLLFTK